MIEGLNHIQGIVSYAFHFIEDIGVNHLGLQVLLVLHSFDCIFRNDFLEASIRSSMACAFRYQGCCRL